MLIALAATVLIALLAKGLTDTIAGYAAQVQGLDRAYHGRSAG